MKTKIIAAASLMAVAVTVIAAVVVVNPFGQSETMMMGGGEESMHTEGMAPLGAAAGEERMHKECMAPLSAAAGEERMHKEGMAPLSAAAGEERMHKEGMAPLTVNIETEKRIIGSDSDMRTVSAANAKPYIGVAISETEGGAVRVVEVLEEGPSNGILRSGDLITAAAGERIGGADDLVDAISDAGAGAALALTVTRDGGASEISVNVGEFSEDPDSGISSYRYSQSFNLPKDGFPMMMDKNVLDQFGKMDGFSDFPMMMDADILDKLGEMGEFSDFMMMDKSAFGGMGGFFDFPSMMMLEEWGESGGIARMEKSVVGENGDYQTHRVASGTVTSVDAAARTFTLQPEDGSAEITYSVSDGAKTLIAGPNGALGLSADGETPTVVMDVDGGAELILQGEWWDWGE